MAAKPWVRVLYWFAMLIDAERIDRQLRELETLHAAELHAAGFHDPQRLHRAKRDALDALRRPMQPPLTPEQLIAIAMQRQKRARGEVS